MAQSPKQPLIETTDLVKKFGAFTALNGEIGRAHV